MDDLPPPPAYTPQDPDPRTSTPLTRPSQPSARNRSITENDPDSTAASDSRGWNAVLQEEKSAGTKKDKSKTHPNPSLGLALYEAVSQRNVQTVEILLRSCADTNRRPPSPKPALTKAVLNHDTEIVRALLERGNPDLEAIPSGGKTALYTAVSNEYADLVRLLLKHGANANFQPSGGQPAIYKAYSNGYKKILWMLLDSDNINVDKTPPGGSTTLYQAAEKEDRETLRALIAIGAAVDAKPSGDVTAMHRAAVRGDVATAEMLLQFGAKVDVRPPGGITALWHATKKSNVEMVRLLLKYRADVNAKAPGGQTVLTQAVKSDETKDRVILNMLLQSEKAIA